MNKSLVDLITKISLFGILVLIFIVLLNILKEPYSFNTGGYESKDEVKAAYHKTKRVGEELDKNLELDKYVEELNNHNLQKKVDKQKTNEYYIPLPKEVKIVGYGRGEDMKPVSNKKNKK